MGRNTCISNINSRVFVKVFTITKYSTVFFRVRMTIIRTNYNDNGMYHFMYRMGELSCTNARVTVIVDTLPECTTTLFSEMEFVKLSCDWAPRIKGDKMQFTAKNQTPQLSEFEQLSGDSNMVNTWTTTTVRISKMIDTQDIFDDLIPDGCLVSNHNTDFDNQCNFPLFMSPRVNEVSEDVREVFFTCCIQTENSPGLWLYDRDNKLKSINITRQLFMVNTSVLNKNQINVSESIVLICGEEKDHTLVEFSIGKLFLNFTYYNRYGVSIFRKIEHGGTASTVLNGEQICPHKHIISVTAYPLKSEHNSTGIITSTEAMTTYILHDSSLPIEPDGSCECLDNMEDDSLLPTNNKRDSVFGDFETWISIIVVLSISLLLNIAVCICKCSNIITLKKSQSFEGNNPHVNLGSFQRNEEEAMEITSLSSQPVQLDEIDCSSSSQTGDDSTKHGRRIPSSRTINYRRRSEPSSGCQQECTTPKRVVGSDSLSVACYRNFVKSAVNEEAYENVEGNAPRDTEYLAGQNSSPVIYQSLSDNSIGESPYSFVDDTEYIRDDVLNLKYLAGNDSRDLQSSRKETSSSDIYYSLTDNDNTHGIHSVGDNGNHMRDITIDQDLEGNSPLESKAPGKEKSPSATYQNLVDNDNAEGYYCIADVEKCIGGDVTYCTNLEGKSPVKQKSLSIINGDEDNSEDIHYVADDRSYNGEHDTNFRSSHYANDQSVIYNSDIPRRIEMDYMYSTTIQEDPDGQYAILNSRRVNDSHNAGFSPASSTMTSVQADTRVSNSEYDCLKRSDVERHFV